ncbi:MAG: D-tyrosyl-tRNA(Tyr) deacylase [Candidatus Omnitrophica bacterium]|nr:D-tyrosyl-tRNA(Tyr) deacylase [Candidatus Omnitrophota bacterium]
MKAIIQRVSRAKVTVDSRITGEIQAGILVLLSVGKQDTNIDADYLADKIAELRIFEDKDGKMNLSISESKGDFLVVSQFTLHGNCEKGRRPSFDAAAEPKMAEDLYNYFIEILRRKNFKVQTGQFASMMDVELTNDGPVTFILESPSEKNN